MSQSEAILLVVSILEGRNFPNLSSTTHLTVDARFDGEILTTDPVELSSTPDINQELAWELDRKTFHHHKIQRSVIKCNAYAAEAQGKRELIGYFIVDIRPLTNAQNVRWCQLLQTKYSKQRPEISICAYIEDDQMTRSSSPASKPVKNSSSTTNSSRPKSLLPIYNEEKKFYQLGNDVSTAEMFSLSIRINSARNLINVFPADADLQSHDGYFLCFSLFGKNYSSEKFLDLTQSNLGQINTKVQIRSTIQLLRSYLGTSHPIDVQLRSDEEIFGRAQIPLNKIDKSLQKSNAEKNFDDFTEDFAILIKAADSKTRIPSDEENQPLLNVRVTLSRNSMTRERQQNQEREENSSSARTNRTKSTSHSNGNHSEFELTERETSRVEKVPIVHRLGEEQRFPAFSFDETSNDKLLSHHYCLSIDLQALRNLRLSHSAYLYCRYVYPFFGSSTAILTQPPLPIVYTNSAPPNEHPLPNGNCIFNFAVNQEQLWSQFQREPLRVEIFSRDQERKERKDQLIGLVDLPLEEVLNAEKQRCASNLNGVLGWRQTWTNSAPIAGYKNEKLGELRVMITLEDLGPLHLSTVSAAQNRPKTPNAVNLDAVLNGGSTDAQLQAAYELQRWKENKEMEFEKHLREIEAKKLYELMEAFKEKDRERESLLQKKMREYGDLEKKMKKTLVDFEKREKQLAITEQEIQRMNVDLKRDYESKYVEIREASKRLQEQSEHQINLEKTKSQALEEEIGRLKRSVNEWEKRYRDKEHEFFNFKEKQKTTPEVKLQAELNLLTLEKNELQRKVESSMASAERYKQQWLKALKEYQRLKQREQDQSKVLLQRQQQELEHMRLRYLAAEENEILKGDHKQLEAIKNELNKIRENSSSPAITGEVHLRSSPEENNDHLEQVDQQLGILIEHRDTLLQTGTYTHNDALIQELERRIQEAMKRKSSSSESAPYSHRYQ